MKHLRSCLQKQSHTRAPGWYNSVRMVDETTTGRIVNELDTKSYKLTSVGSMNGPRAVHFYDARTRSTKTSHFRFPNDPVNTS